MIVGLGQVGSRFDEEPGRVVVWTHAGAYLALRDDFDLVAGCEISPANRQAFNRRCPDVPVYASVSEAIRNSRPDVVSICTQADSHAEIMKHITGATEKDAAPKVIWCEKPLATTYENADTMVAQCAQAGSRLVVSHTRSWMPIWQRMRRRIAAGEVGEIVTVRVATPNRLWSVGSHGVDIAFGLAGPCAFEAAFDTPNLFEEGEPARSAVLRRKNGGLVFLQVTGPKRNFLMEAEVIGTDGRLWAREDRNEIASERFVESKRYRNYLDLDATETEAVKTPADFSPFVAVAEEVAAIARGETDTCTCDGERAMEIMAVLERMGRLGNTEEEPTKGTHRQ